jgi:aminoglycoside 3-N-acetyltransferase
MSEAELVQRTGFPLTAHSLADALRRCGMAEGQTVLVHMAMSKLSWVVGGAQAVIMAFLDVLGPTGTLMMPTHTTYNTDPAEWQHPPVPESWWQTIRNHTPAYDPRTSPTRIMGAVPELFRTWPGVIRSAHPVTSFAALGPNARYLIDDHVLEEETGERSPVGRLYELDGEVLLLGVEHWNNTSLHLAEYRANYPGKRTFKADSSGSNTKWSRPTVTTSGRLARPSMPSTPSWWTKLPMPRCVSSSNGLSSILPFSG